MTFLVGRIIFGVVLLVFGMRHFKNKKEMISYAKSKKISVPVLANIVAGAILLLSGLLIILGIFPDIALVLMIIFLFVVSIVMHDFWNITNKQQKQAEMTSFLMNMALLGTCLMLIYLTYWPYSL